MKQLENENRTTAFMRNRTRRQKAKQKKTRSIFPSHHNTNNDNKRNSTITSSSALTMTSPPPKEYTIRQQIEGGHDVPFLFRCCGVGLLFGDSTEESYLLSKQHEKENYINQQKEKFEKEEYLRHSYGKVLKDKVQRNYLEQQEAYEVVN
jgi:hypothetical protein